MKKLLFLAALLISFGVKAQVVQYPVGSQPGQFTGGYLVSPSNYKFSTVASDTTGLLSYGITTTGGITRYYKTPTISWLTNYLNQFIPSFGTITDVNNGAVFNDQGKLVNTNRFRLFNNASPSLAYLLTPSVNVSGAWLRVQNSFHLQNLPTGAIDTGEILMRGNTDRVYKVSTGSFIKNQTTLQSADFNVTSGRVNTNFTVGGTLNIGGIGGGGVLFRNGAGDVSEQSWIFPAAAPKTLRLNYEDGGGSDNVATVAIGGGKGLILRGVSNARKDTLAGIADVKDGLIIYKNNSNKGLYYYRDGGFKRLIDTTDVAAKADTVSGGYVKLSGDNSTGNINQQAKPQVGYILNDNFQRSSLGANYTSSLSSATITFPSSTYMNVTGGDATYTNYLQFITAINYEYYRSTAHFKLQTQSATSFVGLGFISQIAANPYSLVVKYDVSSAGTQGVITFAQDDVTAAFKTSTAIQIAQGDSIITDVVFERNVVTATLRDVNNGQRVVLTHTYPTSSFSLPFVPNQNKLRLYVGGGTYNFTRLQEYSPQTIGKNAVFVGNSITHGTGATVITDAFPNQVYSQNENLFSIDASQGATVASAMAGVAEVVALNPKYVVIDLGANNLFGGTSQASFQSQYAAYVTAVTAGGAIPIILAVTPQVNDNTAYNAGLSAYASANGYKFVDVSTPLATGTTMNPIYTADGLHPNTAGYALMGGIIRAACPELFTTVQSAIRYDNLPQTLSPSVFVVKDFRGNLATTPIPAQLKTDVIETINVASPPFAAHNLYSKIDNTGVGLNLIAKGNPTGYGTIFTMGANTTNANYMVLAGGNGSTGVTNNNNKWVFAPSHDGAGSAWPLAFRNTTGNWAGANDNITIFPNGRVVIQNSTLAATDNGFQFETVGTTSLKGQVTTGSSTERTSSNSSARGWNYNVGNNTVYDNTGFGYNWYHTRSTTNTSDLLQLAILNTASGFVNAAAAGINGLGHWGIMTAPVADSRFRVGAGSASIAPFSIASGTQYSGTLPGGYFDFQGTILRVGANSLNNRVVLSDDVTPTAGSMLVADGTRWITTAITTQSGSFVKGTGSGTGAATTISIAHGLTGITGTSFVFVTAKNAASGGWSYVTIDSTNVNIVYAAAPASGSNNLSYDFHIKP